MNEEESYLECVRRIQKNEEKNGKFACEECSTKERKVYLKREKEGWWGCPICGQGFGIIASGKAIRYHNSDADLECPYCGNIENIPFDYIDDYAKEGYECIKCGKVVLVEVCTKSNN